MHWLADAQIQYPQRDFVEERSEDFDYGGTVIRCAAMRVPRDAKRRPWDLVQDGSASTNALISEAWRCCETNAWDRTVRREARRIGMLHLTYH
jgi:hypothetical protein